MRNSNLFKRAGAVILSLSMVLSSMPADMIYAEDVTEGITEAVEAPAEAPEETAPEAEVPATESPVTEPAEIPETETPPQPEESAGFLPETEEQKETEQILEPETESGPETEIASEAESESETGLQTYMVNVKSDHAGILFVPELEQLKAGILEDMDVPEKDCSDALEATKEILPEAYAGILTDHTYQVLTSMDHEFDIDSRTSFYIIPETGYEVKEVKAVSAESSWVLDEKEDGFYETDPLDEDILLQVICGEAETEAETETESSSETEPMSEAELETEPESETEAESESETETQSETLYEYEDDDVKVTVLAGPEAGIPEDARLKADKLEGQDYEDAYQKAIEALDVPEDQELVYVPYDVYFEKDGEKIEPEDGTLKVSMFYKDISLFERDEEALSTGVVHIKDYGKTEVLENSAKEHNEAEFEVDSFSVMGSAVTYAGTARATTAAATYAVLYSDGSLVFQSDNTKNSTYGSISKAYPYSNSTTYTASTVPWKKNAVKIQKVVFDARVIPMSTAYWFDGCTKLTTFTRMNSTYFKPVSMTSAAYMFRNCTSLTSFSYDSTFSCRYFYGMFYGCTNLKSVSVINIRPSASGSRTSDMFYNCSSLTSVQLGTGLISNYVQAIDGMFYGCSSLSSINVSEWNFSSVTNMQNVFNGASSLEVLDLSKWNNSNSYSSMSGAFSGCSKLQKVIVGPNFRFGSGGYLPTPSSDNIAGATGSWYTITGKSYSPASIPSRKADTYYASKSLLPTETLDAVLYGDGTLVFKKVTASTLDTTYGVLGYYSGVESLSASRSSSIPWYNKRSFIKEVKFQQTFKPVSMAYWFYGCSYLASFTNLSMLDISSATSLKDAFYNCSKLTVLDLSNFNTNSVTDMSYAFYGCSALQSVKLGKNFKFVGENCYLPVPKEANFPYTTGKWKNSSGAVFTPEEIPSNVADTYVVDIPAYAILYSPSGDISNNDGELVFQHGSTTNSSKGTVVATFTGFDTAEYNYADKTPWSSYSSKIKTVTFKDTIQPISTATWFSGFTNLTTINNLENLDTNNVLYMFGMFAYCSKLTSIDLSGFHTEKVTLMQEMFSGCSSLTCLDLSSFDVRNVTIMDGMFANCTNLKTLDVSNFHTLSAESMGSMFSDCSNLTSLDLSNFYIMSNTYMGAMFMGCSKLQKITLGGKFLFPNEKAYFDTPLSEYFPGTTGKWKNTAGKKFAPSEIPNNVADTYVVDIVNYQIAFDANGGSGSMSNQSFAYGESKELSWNEFTHKGYNFSGWKTSDGTFYADKATISNLTETDGAVITLYAQWNLATYNITYELNGGTISGQKTSYTLETDTFTIPKPTKNGYKFSRWMYMETADNGGGASWSYVDSITVEKGSAFHIYCEAEWEPITYSISYNLDGGNISEQPISYNIESATFTLPTPSKSGYSFAGWTGTGLSSATKSVSVAKGSTGNRSYTATWTANGYTVSFNYNKPTTDGTVGNSGTSSKSVTFNAAYGTLPAPTLNGYSFGGWYTAASGGSQVTDTTKYTTAGNSTLYAHWNLITYTISYTLNGGSISGQPTSYNVNTATFTLPTPSRNGYDFTGWTGSNGTTAQKSVSIAKNSTGNKSYTANWSPINYTITYNLDGGSISGQPTSYNIETATFTLPTPSKSGYSFAGWTGTGLSSATKNVSVAKGSTGNRSYTATWTANSYTVSFNYNKPTTDGTVGNSGTASKSVTFNAAYGTLPAPTLNGYSFGGWYTTASGGSQVTDTTKYTIAGNSTLYAHWNLTTYTISYTLNGGSMSGQPTSYNVNTATFTLPTPIRNGYNFTGWTGSNGTTAQKSVSIAKNSTGNKSYTANWSINQYTLTITGDDGVESITGSGKYNYGTTASTTYKIKTGYHIVNITGTTSGGDSNGNWTGSAGKEGTVSDTWEIKTCDRTVTVHTAPNTYTVKYDGNTAISGSTADSSHAYDAAKALTANGFTKTGYTFKTWNTAADGSGTAYTDSASVKNLTAVNGGTITLYAQWTPNTLTVQYHADGAVKLDDLDVSDKDITNSGAFKYDLEDEGTKQYGLMDADRLLKYGYHCNNTWVVGKGGTVKVDAAKTFSTAKDLAAMCGVTAQLEKGNVTVDLYPNWQINTGTVHYYPNADDVTTTKDGKAFVTSGEFAGSAQGTTGFDYNTKGGSGANTLTDVSSIFERKGYHGDIAHNWRYGAPDSETYFHCDQEDLSPYVKDATNVHLKLYANWIANTYTVKFDGNGADSGSIQDISGTYDTAFTIPTNSFVRTCYEFTGWNTEKDGSGTDYADQESVKNLTDVNGGTVTLYAQWKLSTYNVIFDRNNGTGSMSNQVLTFDKEEALSANTYLRIGYSFNGWNTQADGKGTAYTDQQKVTNLSTDGSDVTLYAQWKIDTYSLTVSNTVSGSMGNKAKDFAFNVKLSNSNTDGAIQSKLTAVFTDENGKETEKELAVSNGAVAVELSHKQSVTLKEIPYGTTYTVTETNGDEYDITKTNDSGTITKDISVSFTNTKNGTVPTSADAPVPYPLMAMAFIGAAILVIGKKKKEKVK